MAIFTAAASAIVGAIGLTGTLATIATSVIATGLAIGTARILGVGEPPDAGGSDQGVKVQLPPATDHKVPKLYGRSVASGIITDAEIKNGNQTMAYCMVLGEYTPGETYTINKIWRDDSELIFGSNTAPGAADNPWTVVNVIDSNSTSRTDITGKLRVRVYAGGGDDSQQIFPVSNPADAWKTPGANDENAQMRTWTSANTMEGLVFAILEVDYDAENNLYGVGNWRFDIENSVSAPGDVLLDYLTNTRYGAGLPLSQINTTSLDAWNAYCAQNVDYLDPGTGSTLSHERYRVDGGLSTHETHKANINRICQAGSAWFTYDVPTGQFGVVVNREATTSEKSASLHLTSDHILGEITISGTDLQNVYNSVEAEFPSLIQQDQTGTVYIEADPSVVAAGEQPNTLSYRLALVNNRARATNLATQDLNQARVNTVVSLMADHSMLQARVGEVIRLTLETYGWNQKLFRVMRVSEQQDTTGVLRTRLQLLEYDDDIYGDVITAQDLPLGDTGISNWWSVNQSTTPVVGDIAIVEDPVGTTATLHDPLTAAVVSTLTPGDIAALYPVIYRDVSYMVIPITIPDDSTFNRIKITIVNQSQSGYSTTITQEPQGATRFASGELVPITINGQSLNNDDDYVFRIKLEHNQSGASSQVFTTGVFNLTSIFNLPPGSVDTIHIVNGAVGEPQLDPGFLSSLDQQFLDLQANLDVLDGDLSNLNTDIINLNADLANLDVALNDNSNAITTLNTVTLPTLEQQLSDNSNSISDLNTIALPNLQSDLDSLDTQLVTLQNVTLPGLQSDLNSNTTDINTLNTVTLPNLQQDLTDLENSVPTLPITTTQISSNAITTPLIAAGAVGADQIAANSITAAQIAANTITANEIAAGTITANQIASGTVTASEIQAFSITGDRLAFNTITGSYIAAGAIDTSELAAGAVTANEIAAGTITANEIAAGTITADRIATGTITTTQIATRSITANDIALNTLTANEIAAGAITTSEIAAGAVTANEIAAGTITANELSSGTIITNQAQMGTATVGTAAIADLAVNTLQIAGDAVTVGDDFDIPAYLLRTVNTKVLDENIPLTSGISKRMYVVVNLSVGSETATGTYHGVRGELWLNGSLVSEATFGFQATGAGTITLAGSRLFGSTITNCRIEVRVRNAAGTAAFNVFDGSVWAQGAKR